MRRKELKSSESYVAFLDILGFKNIVLKNELEKIAELLCKIEELINTEKFALYYAVNSGDHRSKHFLHNKCLLKSRIISMSDSIVVIVPADNRYALSTIVRICNYIQTELFNILDQPVLLRGAITKGEIYNRGSIVCGKALVKAYMAEENNSIYPRIILSEEIYQSGKAVVDREDSFLLKKDKDEYYYIDTYLYVNYDREIMEKLYKLVQENLIGYNDTKIREKYLWLHKKLTEINCL